jgi:hypothetical protein
MSQKSKTTTTIKKGRPKTPHKARGEATWLIEAFQLKHSNGN